MATVSLEHITKRFPSGMAAVDDISFSVADGEFVSLLGPSGCGKSTTLRMIAGLESISSGILTIDGKAVNAVPAKDRDIAMVFQSYALYPHMNVADNLAFGLRRRSVPAEEQRKRVADAAQMLGLTELVGRKPHALSGGQRQRVALGRAIVRDPRVFLFDEPLSNLDSALRSIMRGEIVRLHQRLGTTMIYVTHDQVEAMTMSTRMCIMDRGRLIQVGSPLDVYKNPASAFVARFLGNPPMNLLRVRLVEADGVLSALLGGQSVPLMPTPPPLVPYVGHEVHFGVRPENLSPTGANTHPGQGRLRCDVISVESLGAETILVCDAAGEPLSVRLPGVSAARVGDCIDFGFDVASLHFFAIDTGKAILWK